MSPGTKGGGGVCFSSFIAKQGVSDPGATNSPSQLTVGKRKKLANVESVFNKFDDEEADEQPRKRKLVPLDYGDDDKSLGLDGAEISGAKGSINTEEKRKHIKSLIEKIPTARPELFSYPLDWTMVDSVKSQRSSVPCFSSCHITSFTSCRVKLLRYINISN